MPFLLRVVFVHLAAAMFSLVPVSIWVSAQENLGTDCLGETNKMRCIVCENHSLNISCPAGTVIDITSALYGQTFPYAGVCGTAGVMEICNGTMGVTEILRKCQQKPRCVIIQSAIPGDPCPDIPKYIDINMTCSFPRALLFMKDLKSLNPANSEALENAEDRIGHFSRNHLETSKVNYTTGDAQLHIVVSNISQEAFNSFLQLESSHIDFTVQTNNTNRIVSAVLTFKISTTQAAETRLNNASFLSAKTRYISNKNTSFVVIVGWDDHDNQLSGNASFAVNSTSPKSVCEKIKEEKKNTSNMMVKKLEPKCLFLDIVRKSYSDRGCVTITDDVTGSVTCRCSHLTIFTVLLAVETTVIPESVKIISYTTESVSVVFLVATIVILFKYGRGDDRTPVQINLSVALLLLHAINLTHDVAVLHTTVCEVFTVTLHFILLSVGMWFLIEGVRLLMATSFPYSFEAQDPKTRLKIFVFIGWIGPAIIVGAAGGVGFSLDNYMKPQPLYEKCHNHQNQSSPIPKYDRCWLAPGTPIFYSTVVAPLALVLLINFMIMLKTTYVLFKTRKMQSRDENDTVMIAMKGAKSFFLLLLMLGGTWGLAFFTGIGNEITNEVFMYIHTLVNGSQGIVVFLLYCVMSHMIRQEIVPCKREADGSEQQNNTANTTDGNRH